MDKSTTYIYSFLDYRLYLKNYYNQAKKANHNFSYRYFSRKVGVKAPNFLQWLIEGKRNLAKNTIPKVAKALKLNQKESEYFTNLVLFTQAKTINTKTGYFEKLLEIRKSFNAKQLEESQYEHYSNWYYEAIRELLKYIEFNPKPRYAYRNLGKMVCPAITESQARKAIKQLLKLGLVFQDKNSIIKQSEDFITTGDEVNSFFVRKFHETMISLAKESQDRFQPEVRDVSSVTMSISDDCFALIKKEIRQMRKRVMELVEMDNKPNNVYQLNFQFFPLVPKKK
jgi:uncharacterized protein (TIGR02147 family)